MSLVETNTTYKVLNLRHFTDDTFSVRMERNNMDFHAGQHIVVGIKGDYNTREYSIYSGENDQYLEILVKEVNQGYLSGKLKNLNPGDKLDVFGPMGYFTIDPNKLNSHKFVLIGSGTGIAPFKSFVSTYRNMDYTILHGIRYEKDAYERDIYKQGRYISCTSRDNMGDFNGRVTDYLMDTEFDENTLFYFCGNSEMIYDAMEILRSKGYSTNRMFTEVYF